MKDWRIDHLTAAQLRSAVERLGGTREPVLVVGPPGSGRRAAAMCLHKATRDIGFLTTFHCGIPESLVQAELFGHLRGAFPGVKFGAVERARFGTLLLSELDAFPLLMQPLLVRYLTTGEICMLDDQEWFKPPRVRIVASTSRDLAAEAAAGRLDPQLLTLLSRHTIRLASLAQRRDEIPAIFRFYVDAFARVAARPAPEVTDAVEGALVSHSWPGNLCELERAAGRAVARGHAMDAWEPEADPLGTWREPIEVHWSEPIGNPVREGKCVTSLTPDGLELSFDGGRGERVADLKAARALAREWRRQFLFRYRRYEELLEEFGDEW